MSEKSVEIIITRDSVCMADDINPTHTDIIHFDSSKPPKELIKFISDNYLAKVSGFGHVWEIYLNEQLVGTTSFFRTKVKAEKLTFLAKNYVNCRYFSSTW